jgi:hypothetical protein
VRGPIYTVALCMAAAWICAVLLGTNAQAQKHVQKSDDTTLFNPALRAELLDRAAKDQEIRDELTKKGLQNPDPVLIQRMQDIDSENTEWMAVTIRRYQWPGPDLVGKDGVEAAFLLVQHADLDFQKEVYPIVKEAYKAGLLPGSDYAMLLDRVLVGQGRPQVYGTQAQFNGTEPVLAPIQDQANVDKRRAEVGLPPLAEYLESLKKLYPHEEKPK